jgi:hypothetical protein
MRTMSNYTFKQLDKGSPRRLSDEEVRLKDHLLADYLREITIKTSFVIRIKAIKIMAIKIKTT